jgi:hypothetical protein
MGNYAAINWFIVGCFLFFCMIISTVTNLNKIQYLLLLILSLPA